MEVAARPSGFAWVLMLLAAGLLLAGCGGGDGDSGTLTKAEFIAKGNAICAQGDQQYTELQQTPPKTPEEAATLTQKLIGITNNELNQIRALNAPSAVEPSLTRYLKSREQGLGVLEQGLKAASKSDPRAYAAAQAKMAAGQVDRLRLARAVGFTQCSRPGGAASSASGG